VTVHAEEEMAGDNLSIFDVQHVIFTAKLSITNKLVMITVYVV